LCHLKLPFKVLTLGGFYPSHGCYKDVEVGWHLKSFIYNFPKNRLKPNAVLIDIKIQHTKMHFLCQVEKNYEIIISCWNSNSFGEEERFLIKRFKV